MKKILVIDASALLFRSYFAMIKKPLSTKDGQPTSAVFGFFRMVLHFIKKYPSHSIVAAFDVPRRTLERTKAYNDYKATRKETPPDLVQQIPLAKECLSLTGISAMTVDGHEADDVIATIVKKYSQDHEVLIFTGDKDLLQLVGGNVHVVLPDKSGIDGLFLDRDGVKELKGVYPEQIIDFLAILGDTSDNIPGVKGIGEKGAISLIEEYGSLDQIYAHIDQIKPTLAKKLEESREQAFLSLNLVRLEDNLDIELPKMNDEVVTLSHIATDKFVQKLKELELFSLLKEISVGTSLNDPQSKSESESLFGQHPKTEAIPFGLTTLDLLSKSPFIGIYIEEGNIIFASAQEIFSLPIEQISEYQEMFTGFFSGQTEDKKPFIVFDQKQLWHFFHQSHIILPPCDDLKIMAYLLDPARSKYTISYLGMAYLGKSDVDGSFFGELKDVLYTILEKNHLLDTYLNIEMPLRPILAAVEELGVRIDQDLLKNLSIQFEKDLLELESTITHLAGKSFNILSPKQLGQILFEDLKLKPFKKTKTKSYSTDEETLEALSLVHPLPREILRYRTLSKLKNTYTDSLLLAMDQDQRVHTTLCQTVTATGRLSSVDPNLQNIPIRTELGKKIREAFIAKDGYVLVSADYSQIELRLFALLSNDQTMKKFFEQGGDVHRYIAAEMFGIDQDHISADQRRAAKTINYGISYGMSAFRLANELSIDFGQARKFIDDYFETFPGVKNFMTETLEFASENGYVKTLFGRRRPTPELRAKKIDKITNLSHPSRFAINAVVQGTAADIIKLAMINVQKMITEKFHSQAFMILQIHDELLFEVLPDIAEQFMESLKEAMTHVISLEIPLEVELGKGENWTKAH
ncbi:MAG: DNA polymerase I [Brevinema sp.]